MTNEPVKERALERQSNQLCWLGWGWGVTQEKKKKQHVFSDCIYGPYLVHSPWESQSTASVFLVTVAARFLVTSGEQGRLSTKRNPEKEPGRCPAAASLFDRSQTGEKLGVQPANFKVKPCHQTGS